MVDRLSLNSPWPLIPSAGYRLLFWSPDDWRGDCRPTDRLWEINGHVWNRGPAAETTVRL